MATAPITEEPPVANDGAEPHKPDLLALVEERPARVLIGEVDPDAYVAALRASVEAKGLTPDTKTGLDQIKSEAHSIRSIKAGIDRTRKQLTEHWRNQTAKVNEAGKVIEGKLEALIEEVRAPVTKWEEAEKTRKAEADRIIATLEAAKLIRFGETSAIVQARLDEIRGMNLNDEVLGPRLEMAEDLKVEAVKDLQEAVTNLSAQEAQAAELEQLKRERDEMQRKAEQEAAERLAEQQRQEREKAEQERIARAAHEAADKARREAEQAAEQARRDAEEAAERKRQEEAAAARAAEEERQRQAQAEIDAANRRAAEAEAAAKAERDRIAAEQRAREEAEAAEAEAQRKRDADLAHRQQVIDAAAEKLTELGLTKKLATSIIHAIEAGKVPAVSIKF
ncbi:MAG: hypothetical protein ACT6Q7_02680 [Blastomonas fulva]